jgi:hypothetical protein
MPNKSISRSASKKAAFCIILVLMVVIFSELLLQICSWMSFRAEVLLSKKKNQELLLLKDEHLGVRGNPAYPEHDPNGFRNKRIPERGNVEVVTLGDSQTYGYGVASDEAWPKQLGYLKKCTIYNMAIESSGPIQSFLLFDEAFEIKPKSILAAVYLGNDLYDSYEAIYLKRLAPSLFSQDEKVLKAIADKEKLDPLMERIHKEGAIAYQDERYQDTPTKSFLAEHSKLWGLFAAVQRTFFADGKKDWQAIQNEVLKTKESRQVFDDGKVRTVFTPNYRLIAVDTEDPRIEEGLRITLEVISSMATRAREAHVAFSIVLIPTKENVFKGLQNRSAEISRNYEEQTQKEEVVRQRILAFLREKQITVIDVLPGMRKRTQEGNSLYTLTWDGHPSKTGYKAIAEIVAQNP